MACSGSSHVEKATGGLPCLRREKRSSSAAATISPSTTSAAAGSWNTALTPRTLPMREALSEKRFSGIAVRHSGDQNAPYRSAELITGESARVIRDRAQALERPPDQPRHVHLGNAHALGDLGLREVLHEAQVE